MSLQKQPEYNKGFFMYRLLSNEAPEYISYLYTHTPSCYSSSRNYHLSLPRPRTDIFKTSISFSGAHLWNSLPLKGFFMYRLLSNEAPEYISYLYTHTPSCYSSSRNYHLSLPRPRTDIFKTSISFSGAHLWNNLPLTVRSCQSLNSFKCKLRAHLEVVT